VGVVVAGVSVAAVVVAAIALASRLVFVSGDEALTSVLPSAAGRLSYPIGYWNALGALMAIGLPGVAWLAASARGRVLAGGALAAFAPLLLTAYMASSRGALIAAALGIGVVVAFARDRRRALAAATVGVACAVPAIAVATVAPGIVDTPGGDAPGRAEAAVVLALAGGMAIAALAGPRVVAAIAGSRVMSARIPVRTWPIAFGVALVVAVALAGPAVFAGDVGGGGEVTTADERVGVVSTSGSGRTSFWETALDAFAEEPVRGIGAGGYEEYWNENGPLATPTRNAHSEPLEVLAELGLAGFACLAAFFAAVLAGGIAAARTRDGGPAAAALGLVLAGAVGFAIDWTWQFPAVAVPFLLGAGALAGAAPPRRAPVRVPAVAGSVAVAAVAAAAIWAAGALGAGASRLEAGEEALAAGRLDDAAAASRGAISVQPWAADPWLQLAEAEELAGNRAAAFAAVREAIDRAPQDYRPWLLASGIRLQLGDTAGNVYRTRGLSLYPLAGDRG
jgi:hypothetical protein